MTETRQRLNASDFARGIIIGLISKGIWRLYWLQQPRGHEAAKKVYDHIEKDHSDSLELDFYMFLHDIHGTSGVWNDAVDGLLTSTVLVRASDGSYIANISIEFIPAWLQTVPGNLEFWQKMAIIYRDYCPHCID